MNTKNNRERSAQHEPRLVGSIISEMLRGDSPLAKGYRKFFASKESGIKKEGGINNMQPQLAQKYLSKPQTGF